MVKQQVSSLLSSNPFTQNALVRRNFSAKAAYFAQQLPNMNVVDTNDYTVVDCGLPSNTFNVVIPKTTDLLVLTDLFDNNMNEFTRKRFPLAFWCWDDLFTPGLTTLLHYYELAADECNVAMRLNLQHYRIKPPRLSPLHIRPVQTPADYDQFADVIAELFGTSSEADQIRYYYWQVSLVHQSRRPMQLFVGEVDGQVVTTGTLFLTVESAGIYDIATCPDWRGRGFGSQLVNQLLWEAQRQSASQVVLQSSADGLGIYKRAGFTEAGTVHVFENRHSF